MPTATDSTAYLRPNELAATLRITTRTLCRWRKDGVGPAFVQRGRIVRYRGEDVDAWARASRHVGD